MTDEEVLMEAWEALLFAGQRLINRKDYADIGKLMDIQELIEKKIRGIIGDEAAIAEAERRGYDWTHYV